MSPDRAALLLAVLGVYLVTGLGFGVWFVRKGCDRIDPSAEAGSLGFRLLILPASVALWPVLLGRLAK